MKVSLIFTIKMIQTDFNTVTQFEGANFSKYACKLLVCWFSAANVVFPLCEREELKVQQREPSEL